MDTEEVLASLAPSEYLEKHVFPVLLEGMENTLQVAKNTEILWSTAFYVYTSQTLYKRRRCFNPIDHLAAYLYRNNPRYSGRHNTAFDEIPFVKEEWAVKPRPPLPLSATLTKDEAATIIQSHYRGYVVRVRKDPRAQLFRTWKRKVSEEVEAASKIQRFWKRRSTITKPVGLARDNEGICEETVPEHDDEDNQTVQEAANAIDKVLT